MTVDRCTCFQQLFSDLRRVADRHDVRTVDELQEHVVFGESCGLCRPYVRRMLRTGETRFHEFVREEDEPVRGP